MQSSVRHGHTANHLEVIPICAIYWFRLTLKSSSTFITSSFSQETRSLILILPPLLEILVFLLPIVAIRLFIFGGHSSHKNSRLETDPDFSVFGFESWVYFFSVEFHLCFPTQFYLKCTLKHFIYCTTFSLCRLLSFCPSAFLSIFPRACFITQSPRSQVAATPAWTTRRHCQVSLVLDMMVPIVSIHLLGIIGHSGQTTAGSRRRVWFL